MILIEIAKIYTQLILLDKEISDQEHEAKDSIAALRTEYHELLMAKMRQEGIDFSDRFDAMNKAFQLIQGHARPV